MPLTKMTTNVNNIQALSDRPNTADGLTSAELKERFDKAGADIKTYLNTVLTEELDDSFVSVNQMIQNAREAEYPVGRIVMFYDDTDHSDYLGFTWQRCLIGKVPTGLDTSDADFDTIGETGGEKTHTLTISEMPSHSHKYGAYLDWYAKGSTHNVIGGGTNLNTSSVGGGQAHNIMQPYEVVSFWKRIS